MGEDETCAIVSFREVPVERLKPFAEILEPDRRMPLRVVVNRQTGESRPRLIDDHYADIAAVQLSERIPEEIRNAFVTAQYAALYSWYAYALVPVAMLHTLATLELALKTRIGGENPKGLQKRASLALDRGWLDGGRLFDRMEPYFPPALEIEGLPPLGRGEARAGYGSRVVKSLVDTRNALAHGMYGLYPHTFFDLHLVAAMIEQLFEKPFDGSLKAEPQPRGTRGL